jgi:hypothetical protein
MHGSEQEVRRQEVPDLLLDVQVEALGVAVTSTRWVS